jgi:hypothetical protein
MPQTNQLTVTAAPIRGGVKCCKSTSYTLNKEKEDVMNELLLRRRMMAMKAEVPKEYKRLERILIPRYAYLNTGLSLTQDDELCLTLIYKEHSYGCALFRSDYIQAGYTFSKRQIFYKFGTATGYTSISPTVKHKIKISAKGLYVDGEKVADITTTDFASSSILIPTAQTGGSGTTAYYGNSYYYESYCIKDGVKIKIIPCQRISDGKIGFYMTEVNQFKASSGTAEFQIG